MSFVSESLEGHVFYSLLLEDFSSVTALESGWCNRVVGEKNFPLWISPGFGSDKDRAGGKRILRRQSGRL
jgi:hypothetical protein